MPYISPTEAATHAARDLIEALKHPAPPAPFVNLGDAKLVALKQLAENFKTATEPTSPPKDIPVPPPRVVFPASPPRVMPQAPSPRVVPPTPPPKPPHRYNTRAQANTVESPTPNNPCDTTTLGKWTQELKHLLLASWATQPAPEPTSTFACAIIDSETGAAMEYLHLIQNPKYAKDWTHSFANELGRLAQGVGGREEGTNTFLHTSCGNSTRPPQTEPNRTRLTIGGNLIDYPGDVSTATAETTTAKILFNSVVSTKNAKFACFDIKNYYLGTPLERHEFMRLPEEIMKEYNLYADKLHNGYVYIRIEKGMYGLPQAGIFAQKLLTERLQPEGYYPCRYTPGLWKHKWRPITFMLVVDDFGVKYIGNSMLTIY
eukprot:scaffold43259_cov66-Attheya_sp.AAC.3